MVLLVAEPGPLATALEQQLSRRDGPFGVARPRDPDLFQRALGHRAIVYVPAASILAQKLDPEPDVGRIRSVLGASNAPGVRVLVAVLPEGYHAEIDAIRRFGTPYVILEAPPLLEEVAQAMTAEAGHTLWLPQRGRATFGTAEAVAREAIAAIDTEWQGRVVPVTGDVLGPKTLLERAAAVAGIRLRIRRISAWLYRWLGRLRRWFGSPVPTSRALVERLFPELGSPARPRALPPPAAA
jgi:hypothetical protein